MSQLLKTNVGKAVLSARIAIDMGFSAYYLTVHPEHVLAYLDEEHDLQKRIFWRIKAHLQRNSEEFPMAAELMGTHELASKHAAHASFESMRAKLQFLKEEGDREKLILNYFDKVDEQFLLQSYYFLLITYYRLLKLFYECFFKKQFRVVFPEREKKVEQLGEHLLEKYKQYAPGIA
jgi:hypothetical protein